MNHLLINKLNAIANGLQYAIQYGSQYTAPYNHGAICREAVAEIERLEKELKNYTDSYNAAVSKSIRLQEPVEELNNEKNRLDWEIARLKRFPEVNIKPEELFGDSGLSDRDHIAIAAMEGILARVVGPEDSIAAQAYKYADAMLKARVK